MCDENPATDVKKKICEFSAGDIVMEQGEKAKGLYVLLSGVLEVFFNNVKVAQVDKKGAFVGEIASLLGGKRIATVKAATPVTMMYVEKVSEYLENNPSTALIIAQTLALRITAMNQKFSHFEQVASNWLSIAEDAVAKHDIEMIKNALVEMQEVFHKELKAG